MVEFVWELAEQQCFTTNSGRMAKSFCHTHPANHLVGWLVALGTHGPVRARLVTALAERGHPTSQGGGAQILRAQEHTHVPFGVSARPGMDSQAHASCATGPIAQAGVGVIQVVDQSTPNGSIGDSVCQPNSSCGSPNAILTCTSWLAVDGAFYEPLGLF